LQCGEDWALVFYEYCRWNKQKVKAEYYSS
jgi:hypothetical protein